MDKMIGQEAKKYLENLPRINQFSEHSQHSSMVYLLPAEINYNVNDDSTISTQGLSSELDRKKRDLINVIVPEDPLHMKYLRTNVLTPLTYAESLPDILWHITTQAILYTRVTNQLIEWIGEKQKKNEYGKHSLDNLWLPCSRPLDSVKPGECIGIFNRRVDGWDGSIDRPVIELLGAGGHLPSIWDTRLRSFRPLNILENLQKEVGEELGFFANYSKMYVFGGYNNEVTHELVILSGIEISADYLPKIESFAVKHIDPDTMGVYLGNLSDVIRYYKTNPEYFAGGRKALSTNFPNQDALMQIVKKHFDFFAFSE